MIKIKINGKNIPTHSGKTIFEAATDAGIYIPNLCYHPDLAPIGACRLCIVEIKGVRGLPTSCTTEAQEGMVIKTNTPEIQDLRKKVLWLILSEHPKDIEASSQLKKVAEWIGVEEELPGYEPQTKGLPITSEEPLFIRDLDRCILCGRCVRICQDMREIGAIGLAGRGMDTIVGTGIDKQIKDSGCKFCRACVEVCPTGALRDKTEFEEENKKAELLPCKNACPAGIDVSRYVRLVAEGRFQDSLEVIRETVPFPHVLGCVCTHPCEEKCFRDDVNEPIAIRALKKFVPEQDTGRWREKIEIASDTGKRVAVVGSGPAGLTAAWFLCKAGHTVTVFEAMSEAGGMMRSAIPRYRLPADILDKEIGDIANIGVMIEVNKKIESTDELFDQGFDAIFYGLGAPHGMKMGIPGENDPRVLDGISVLEAINFGREIDLGKKVAVVGGGNVAIDVARSALRMGAETVTMLYRRGRSEMPAAPEEIEEALEEGVVIDFLTTPVKVLAEANKLVLESLRMELGEPDESGRRRPVPIEGSEFAVEANSLVMAIGQSPDVPEGLNISTNRRGRIEVDSETLVASRKGVFAGGDVVTGPDSIIAAIQAGRVAADSIDKYLGGPGRIDQKFVPEEDVEVRFGREEGFADRERVKISVRSAKERIHDFAQAEESFNEEAAKKEASRCLRCQARLKISSAPLPPEKK